MAVSNSSDLLDSGRIPLSHGGGSRSNGRREAVVLDNMLSAGVLAPIISAAPVAHVPQGRVNACVMQLLVATRIRADEFVHACHGRAAHVRFGVDKAEAEGL